MNVVLGIITGVVTSIIAICWACPDVLGTWLAKVQIAYVLEYNRYRTKQGMN